MAVKGQQSLLMQSAEIKTIDYNRRYFVENGKMVAVEKMKTTLVSNGNA